MKVKCVENKVLALSSEVRGNYQTTDEVFSIIIGKEYIVYAIGEVQNNTWYCICDESYFLYPMWNPFPLFEITDNRLSRYWVFAFEEWENKKLPLISFPEWANDSFYYGELVDGNSNDKNAITFRKYKELMDLEFPDNSITETAQIGDKEWLICPTCIDAWNCSNDQDGMVKCPKCEKVLQNPRYQDRLKIII